MNRASSDRGGMTEYVLLLGSNMGNRALMLDLARNAISERIGDIRAVSAVYASAAWGFESDDDFLNQALRVKSSKGPTDLLAVIHSIEEALGRIRPEGQGYTSRTIDIDILHWEGGAVEEPGLRIPHPRLPERRFALVPMCQVAGQSVHPLLGQPYADMLDSCQDDSQVMELTVA